MKRIIMAALATLLITGPAFAKPKHQETKTNLVFDKAAQPAYPMDGGDVVAGRKGYYYPGTVVGGRPAGCPLAYCGCGTSLKVFGKIYPELNLAYNWIRKFPITHPAAGMVAARSGHVFYIQSVIDSVTVVAYDPNSGGGKTRVHNVSLRGYKVVNPYGTRMASR